jgi:hypothetical protein
MRQFRRRSWRQSWRQSWRWASVGNQYLRAASPPPIARQPLLAAHVLYANLFYYYLSYTMGFLNLNASSSLYCQDQNCREQFPDRAPLVPKMGSESSKFRGKAFIVVRANLTGSCLTVPRVSALCEVVQQGGGPHRSTSMVRALEQRGDARSTQTACIHWSLVSRLASNSCSRQKKEGKVLHAGLQRVHGNGMSLQPLFQLL